MITPIETYIILITPVNNENLYNLKLINRWIDLKKEENVYELQNSSLVLDSKI